MLYVQLYQIKKHLNIDEQFTDDDEYLVGLCEVAQATVETHIDMPLNKLAKKHGGKLPSPVFHAILIMIGNLYASRESVSFSGNAVEIPLNYQYLIDLYRNYGDDAEEKRKEFERIKKYECRPFDRDNRHSQAR